MKKKTLKKGRGGVRRGVKMLRVHTDRHTDRHTYTPSDEAGPRGAFAPKKGDIHIYFYTSK